ncbi:DUF4097 family beta strand repeat-containing protein [Chengkuizengella sediminis]|uniref:DUF4097 family beta strand repeat-containing protein n=1 Tax=Chengkuizengella sediminis TaxID=1885917 RepID=UPI00138A0C6A|nr:DUF4097 family beta strand repeat-containing protein [Chengkuizengella sediminis]NDI35997.1 DUF4097 family beta strand repeat protein [Chengkuizengella sediminis]
MNKNEFLKQLEFLLKDVHEADRREILYDFLEHFDIGLANGKSEEELVRELGDPKVIAKDLLSDYRVTKNEDKPNGNKYKGILANFRQSVFKTIDIFEERIVSGETYNNIYIKTGSTDVIVVPTVKDEIKVRLSGEASKRYEDVFSLNLKEMGDTLQIELKQKSVLFTVGFSIIKVDLYLEIPQKLYDSFKVDLSSGDIEAKELQAKELILSTSSGDVEIEGLQGNNVKLYSASGNVGVQDGNVSSNISIGSSSGDIKSENITANSLTMEVSSGKIEFTNSEVKTSNIETSSGNITIYNDELKGDIKATTTSGDITIDLEETNESLAIDFKTYSGDVDVKRDGYLFDKKSDSRAIGKIGSGEYNIEARASSGDITLR